MSDFPETPADGAVPPSAPPPYSQPHDAAGNTTSAPPVSEADERNWAMIGHLSALLGAVIPTANMLAPLVVWQLKKDTMPFAAEQARESLNFNITAAIAAVVCIVLKFVLIGFLLFPIVAVAWLVLTIIGGLAASRGEHYRYPFALRFVN